MRKLSVKIMLWMLVALWGWVGSAQAANLTLLTNPSGFGTVAPSSAGSSCSPVTTGCQSYSDGTVVTITQTANTGYSFSNWSGGCSGSSTCTVTLSSDTTVTANFKPNLTINNDGKGSGSVLVDGVDSSLAGSACLPDVPGCRSYDKDKKLTLTAIVASSGLFIGWTGDCTGSTTTCNLTMDRFKTVNATFSENVSVQLNGTGYGGVTSSPVGIDCSLNPLNPTSDCSQNYADGTITLTATPADSGSGFSGWSGNVPVSCLVTPAPFTCVITAPTVQAKTVTASFTSISLNKANVTIINQGSGSDYGQVTSTPGGITCEGNSYALMPNTDCTQAFDVGSGVDLVAKQNNSGVFFSGWKVEFLVNGSYVQQTTMCLGLDPTCHVTVPFNVADIRVKPQFDLNYILTLRRDGTGVGSITTSSEVSNIQSICSDVLCTQTYAKDAKLTLTANSTSSSKFVGWSGAPTASNCSAIGDTVQNPVCIVTMNQAQTIAAKFDPINPSRYELQLIKEGSGSDAGVVQSTYPVTNPLEINCGGEVVPGLPGGAKVQDCSGNFSSGDGITLNADIVTNDSTGAHFSGWEVYFLNNDTPPKYVLQPNMCTGSGPDCHITMIADAQVRAKFDLGFILSVVRNGTGKGSVVVDNPDLNSCTTAADKPICQQTFVINEVLTLTAVSDSKSRFVGWSGCSSMSGTDNRVCTVEMNVAKLVTATFDEVASIVVTNKGAGNGVVTSDIKNSNDTPTINCGISVTPSICSANFNAGAGVTLTATASSGSTFVKWGGVCTSRGSSNTCQVTVTTASQAVEAYYELNTPDTALLSINKGGSGQGSIISIPDGINCGTDCYEIYKLNSTVTLLAVPNTGSKITGWSGDVPAACNVAPIPLTCDVIVDKAKSVNVTFDTSGFALTVAKDGQGTGRVLSEIPGIDCGADCNEIYPESTPATLYAIPDKDAVFAGWRLDGKATCSTTFAKCEVTMAQAHLVVATFNVGVSNNFLLTVAKDGQATGRVLSDITGIDCGIDCSETYPELTKVKIYAVPDKDSVFSGWNVSGDPNLCIKTSPICEVDMKKANLVIATFNVGTGNNYLLTVAKIGQGGGRILSEIAGIDCGTDCTESYSQSTGVKLFAIPDKDSRFVGWKYDGTEPNLPDDPQGKNCTVDPICIVSMDQARFMQAEFDRSIVGNLDAILLKQGSGSAYGIVTSKPTNSDGAINCGAIGGSKICSGSFPASAGLSFNATTDKTPGVTFSRWQVYFKRVNADGTISWIQEPDMCTGFEPNCDVTLAADVRVTARFDFDFILTTVRDGTGTGTILSTSPELNTCTLDDKKTICNQTFVGGQIVNLTAIASINSKFVKWTACTSNDKPTTDPAYEGLLGTNQEICRIKISEAKLVTASFDSLASIAVSSKGAGTGSVTSAPSGINCGASANSICAANFNIGAGVTLTATANSDSRFVKWGGACQTRGSSSSCLLTVTKEPQAVEAYFELLTDNTQLLNVTKNGGGTGKVITFPDGVDCGTDCYEKYITGTSVKLLAITDAGSQFKGWVVEANGQLVSGVCSGTVLTCDVLLDKSTTVTAIFEKILENNQTLSVTVNGAGKVFSSPAGIDCGTSCLKTYPLNTTVVLQAQPSTGARFVGWSGGGCSGSDICFLTLTSGAPVSVVAKFEAALSLTVNNFGTGQGTVVSENVSGISCGTNCSADFSAGTGVKLRATPGNNSRFKGWSGACSASAAQSVCSLTISGTSQTVGAEFEVIDGPMLTITKSGTGSGTITSTPAAIDCGVICNETFATNTLVRLLATPSAGSGFTGWGGACANRVTLLTCDVTMDQAKTVTAAFNPRVNPMIVAIAGVGSGTISSTPPGISCGNDCTENFLDGITVGLSVVPNANSVFIGWDGSCAGQSGTCYVKMTEAQSATAKFALANQLTVLMQGNGFGTVVSNPTGISCEGTCNATFLKDTAITLTANVLGGSQFSGWTGACTGSQATCFVKMKDSLLVTASFTFIANSANGSLLIGKLNDTGADWCANNGVAYLANKEGMCVTLMTSHPYQDGQEGRDMYARQGLLTKLGKGEAGFDYTKICNNGKAAGEGDCPAAPVFGAADTNWGCTRDNVTNLIWEVKTVGGVRDKDAQYTWFEPNDRINGGSKGDDCSGVSCKNTKLYIDAVNTQGLCGANDWRLPSRQELHSIVNQGRGGPSVDITYFPNTASKGYWTSTPVAAQIFNAWYVNFEYGWDYWANKSSQQHARLVRACQTCEDNSPVSNPSFQNGRLKLPQVGVDGQFYSANLTQVSSEPLTFVLSSALPLGKRIGRNANQVVYYSSSGLAVIGGVEVGNDQYNATLEYVPGSNPAKFVLKSARYAR